MRVSDYPPAGGAQVIASDCRPGGGAQASSSDCRLFDDAGESVRAAGENANWRVSGFAAYPVLLSRRPVVGRDLTVTANNGIALSTKPYGPRAATHLCTGCGTHTQPAVINRIACSLSLYQISMPPTSLALEAARDARPNE